MKAQFQISNWICGRNLAFLGCRLKLKIEILHVNVNRVAYRGIKLVLYQIVD